MLRSMVHTTIDQKKKKVQNDLYAVIYGAYYRIKSLKCSYTKKQKGERV